MRRFCPVSIALLTAALTAQQKVQPKRPAVPKAEMCGIEGQAVNAATGESVKNAEILLFRVYDGQSQRYTTSTKAGGQFVFEDVEPGKYRLSATRGGYAHMDYGARAAGHPGVTLSLDPGQHVSDIVFRIAPQAVIVGRALDEDGDPMPNVQVQTLSYRFVSGKRQAQLWRGANTNDLGEYRIYGLAPGKYYLSARYNGQTNFRKQSYAQTYYPNTSNPASATAVDLRAGAVLRGIDITLLKARVAHVRGRLENPFAKQQQASNGIRVWLAERDASNRRITFGMQVNDEGMFELPGVSAGAYSLEAVQEVDGKTYTALVPIDVGDSDVENVAVELVPSFDLKGQLRVEGRQPPSLTEARVGLVSGRSVSTGRAAQVAADGSFTITNIAPDEYRLNVSGVSGDYYLKSERLGDQDVLDSGLDLSRSVVSSLEIVLSGKAGQIEGVVLNAEEQPAMGALVALVPDEPRRAQPRLYKQVTTDQYGRFTIRGVAPGAYKLFAWEDIDDGAYQDPEFLKAFEARGEPVAMREGSRESAQLKLIPAEEKKPAAN